MITWFEPLMNMVPKLKTFPATLVSICCVEEMVNKDISWQKAFNNYVTTYLNLSIHHNKTLAFERILKQCISFYLFNS